MIFGPKTNFFDPVPPQKSKKSIFRRNFWKIMKQLMIFEFLEVGEGWKVENSENRKRLPKLSGKTLFFRFFDFRSFYHILGTPKTLKNLKSRKII